MSEANKLEWKSGFVRPTLRAEVCGHFALHTMADEWTVTHLESGLKGHESPDYLEAKAVADAYNEMSGWGDVRLHPDRMEPVYPDVGFADRARKIRLDAMERFRKSRSKSSRAEISP